MKWSVANMALRRKNLPNGKSILGLNRSEIDNLYKEVFQDRVYDFEGAAELPDDPVIFDVGANIGMFSLFAAQEWPSARIFAFEPVTDIFRVLEMNLADLPGATLHNLALGERMEERDIVYYPNFTMMSGFDADAETDRATAARYIRNTAADISNPEAQAAVLENVDGILDGRFEQQIVPVQVERITEIMARHNLDRIDLLKVDVEGFELPVLRGIDDEIWPAIGSVVVEIADREGELSSILELFRSNGMRTDVQQVREYRETNLYIVLAER
ncbi:FkbM family methyltransferase [Streptomyces sioyaensis]|uniref:FkbM family methyltransferase n=1 Tax=Streptomyces sioyaensis TaxID=67364 RepID=UPI0037D080E0